LWIREITCPEFRTPSLLTLIANFAKKELGLKMQLPLLSNIVIILALATAVLLVCSRLRIPSIVGFLITGVIAGPSGFHLIQATSDVETLAEIGVVFLLFTIGMEFSFKRLSRLKRTAILGGSLQIGLTILAMFFIALRLGFGFRTAIFLGFLFSLSSTAIVLRTLQDKAQIESPHGSSALAILIFQDVMVVPMMLIIPVLAGGEGAIGKSLLILLAKAIGIILLVIISAQWLIPRLLFQIARTKSPELFMLSIVLVCLAVAWLTSSLGLSLALGAFLAGLIISESEYSYQALSNIYPFRDVFTSFFFISVGMLLDLNFLIQHPVWVILFAFLVLMLKFILASLSVLMIGFPFRTSALTGLALSQVGEFSFILAGAGLSYQLFSGEAYQYFLAISIITMILTPWIIELSPKLADWLGKVPVPKKMSRGFYPLSGISEPERASLKDHLIAIGYGVNGRNVTRAARIAGIKYVIIEMNPETVRQEKAKGENIFYGDATQDAVLIHAGVKTARVAVIAISDPVATRRICANLRRLNSRIHIIARTRYVQEMKPLYQLAADEVVPEEFETAVEIFARVLRKYLIPDNEIEKFIYEIRADNYEMFRSLAKEQLSISDLKLPLADLELRNFRIGKNAPIAGKSLAQVELRKKYGVTVLAIRRDNQINYNPEPDAILYENDIVVLLGKPDKIAGALPIFTGQV